MTTLKTARENLERNGFQLSSLTPKERAVLIHAGRALLLVTPLLGGCQNRLIDPFFTGRYFEPVKPAMVSTVR